MSEQDKTLSIHLDEPIKFSGGEYQQLDLREFTVGEWKKSELHSRATAQYTQLLSSVSTWPVPAIEMLPISKFDEAIAFLVGFMRRGQATGEN